MIKPSLIRCFFILFLGIAPGLLWPGGLAAQQACHPSISEVVLFGTRPVQEFDPALYPEKGRPCVAAYLAAISPDSPLRRHGPPAGPEEAVKARRRNLAEQMTVILGKNAQKEAELFASALPMSAEWEGMSEGPLDEAGFVDNWMNKRRETSAPIAPFLYLLKAHRLRAGFEAAKSGHEKGLWPILAKRYREALDKAKSYGVPLISCIADDLDAQPQVYLEGQGRP